MVHNMPNFPILSSATKESIGPGTYGSAAKQHQVLEGMNFIMMPHNVRCGFVLRYEHPPHFSVVV
jgi:hypothetical protein